jgi:hypothetical protein
LVLEDGPMEAVRKTAREEGPHLSQVVNDLLLEGIRGKRQGRNWLLFFRIICQNESRVMGILLPGNAYPELIRMRLAENIRVCDYLRPI